ncbi:MAG TPA: twin-arginine translocase TatA/TatE family subunit [Verrucomicrobiota bacterium]|mgnify:CR=1 FL=1|nr:twin-arginine translocase TatA/TatE family subunit [Verrucomicrobiota bacterium]|tara:strand:+ start:154 stop:426 length:273 start_codon:yes stop_codon:yes gene_type:complete
MTTLHQLAFGGLGPWEIILILAVVLVLFGAKKLPELAKGMGQGIKEFKKATRGVNDELERAMDDTPTYTPPPTPQITEQKDTSDESKKDA